MQPRSRLLLVIPAIPVIVAFGWFLTQNQYVRSLWSHNKLVIALAVAVVLIALSLSYLRSNFELQPDPFFLSLTFFAFAAQCIRTVEAWQTDKADGLVLLLFGAALLLLFGELAVIKKHGSLTISRYEEQLGKANLEAIAKAQEEGTNKKAWQTGEISRWAKALVKIAGTDFLPGSDWLLALASMFETESKEKSKRDAVSILPETDFIKTSENLRPNLLNVPDPDRKRFSILYILLPALSWGVYVAALFASR